MGYSGREKSLRILLRCTLNALTKCRVRKLLFDPRIHGYDGENDGCASITGEGEPIEFSKDVGTVIVNYSYQGLENYEELISDGVKNPQDYSIHLPHISQEKEEGLLTLFHTSVLKFNLLA